MQAITFPIAYDNEVAHRQLKLLMKQGRQLKYGTTRYATRILIIEIFGLGMTARINGL